MITDQIYPDSIPAIVKTIELIDPQIEISFSFNRERDLFDISNGFKDRISQFLRQEIDRSSFVKMKEFIRTPHLYPDLLEELERHLIHPDTFVRGYIYLYVLEKTESSIKFKVGASTNVDLRKRNLKKIIGESIEFYTFTAKSIFEIEHFLKVLLDEYKIGTPELFETTPEEFEKVLFYMDAFQGSVGTRVLHSNGVGELIL